MLKNYLIEGRYKFLKIDLGVLSIVIENEEEEQQKLLDALEEIKAENQLDEIEYKEIPGKKKSDLEEVLPW